MNKSERLAWMRQELDQIEQEGQLRQLAAVELLPEGWLQRDGRRMLNLASNDYLGLSLAPLEPLEPQDVVGSGSTASRLIVGNSAIYDQFERDFAAFKGTEASLLFSCGYMANTGAISAIADRTTHVFSDKLNHASIVDGIILSRAQMSRYRHRDLNHLEYLLSRAPAHRRKLIVSDAIFSMDGTIAPLQDLVTLKERYGAMLMIDEAHSGGVYGDEGQGLAHAHRLTNAIDIHMGTFSKAYGCYGAYIAGDQDVIHYLINKARSLIYTTALPPAWLYTLRARFQQVRQEHWRRTQLLDNADYLRTQLRRMGFNTGESMCQIIPLILGDNRRTVMFSQALQEEGIAAVAIRPPTVPDGSARIRLSVMGIHRKEDLDHALRTFQQLGQQMGLI